MSLYQKWWNSQLKKSLCYSTVAALIFMIPSQESFADSLIDLNLGLDPSVECLSGDGAFSVGYFTKAGSTPVEYQPFKYDVSKKTFTILSVETANQSGYA